MAEEFDVGAPLPEESSNRTFVIAAAGLGGLLILSMICLGVYALVIAPNQEQARIARSTEIVLENTQVARSLTQTAAASDATATPEPTDTPTPTEVVPTETPTQVVVLPTETPFTTLQTVEPMTATAAAQATLDAEQQAMTPTPTPTALPVTGFADEAGLPGLLMMGAALVALVFVARRLRMASS